MNMLLNALFELLSAVPTIEADVQSAFAAWHNAHGDVEKTAAAVDTATKLIAGAGAVATAIEADVLGTVDTGKVKLGGGAIHY